MQTGHNILEFQLFFPPFLNNFSHFEGPENTPSEAIFPLFSPVCGQFRHFFILYSSNAFKSCLTAFLRHFDEIQLHFSHISPYSFISKPFCSQNIPTYPIFAPREHDKGRRQVDFLTIFLFFLINYRKKSYFALFMPFFAEKCPLKPEKPDLSPKKY